LAFLSLRLVFDQGTGVTQYMNSGGTIRSRSGSPAIRIYDRSGGVLTLKR
jgi:hypothetical protein